MALLKRDDLRIDREIHTYFINPQPAISFIDLKFDGNLVNDKAKRNKWDW